MIKVYTRKTVDLLVALKKIQTIVAEGKEQEPRVKHHILFNKSIVKERVTQRDCDKIYPVAVKAYKS